MIKLNNKGFTLVEVLAVLVIMVVIMSIAIPNISSSLERSKSKQDEERKKILKSAAELYVTDHKNKVNDKLKAGVKCKIKLDDLGDYITDEQKKKSDGESFGCIYVKKVDGSYEFSIEECNDVNDCISE